MKVRIKHGVNLYDLGFVNGFSDTTPKAQMMKAKIDKLDFIKIKNFCVEKGIIKKVKDFPGGAVVKNLPANAGDTGSSPGLGRSHMPRSN